MKTRIVILPALLALLLLVNAPLAWSATRESAQVDVTALDSAFAGDYRLTCVNWRVSGVASGGGYRLASLSAPTLTGNGCCCTYLPLIRR